MNKGSTKAKRQENSRSENEEPTRKPGTSIAEWIVAGVSCLALLAVLGYLIRDGLSGRNGAADIIVLPTEVTAMNDGYVVEFAANNRAGKSVAAVEIKGELRDGEEVVEESGVTIDYIPQKSERKGALIFRSDPEGYELRILRVDTVSLDQQDCDELVLRFGWPQKVGYSSVFTRPGARQSPGRTRPRSPQQNGLR